MPTPTPTPAGTAASTSPAVAELLAVFGLDDDGLVHGCGCGHPHPPVTRHLIDSDPGAWRRARRNVLGSAGWQCEVVDTETGERCSERASVLGHIYARRLGGCDRRGNLRAECKPHSDSDSGRITADERSALEVARLIVAKVTESQDPLSSRGVRDLDPAMKVFSLSRKPAGQGLAASDAGMNLEINSAADGDDEAPAADDEPVRVTLRNTPGPADSVWDAAPWLDELREVPPEGVWPRYMTLPHPRAVGTYGPEVEPLHIAISGGKAMRWWQRLAAYRILEHDADGVLVWGEYLGTISRQGGKSWLMRALALWRLQRGAELWGEQLVTHTGRDKAVVLEVARAAMAWAEANGLVVSRNNGREGIGTDESMETGSRWLLLAQHAAYGRSATNALVDEAWDVRGATVDDGIVPTMVEQTSPQLGLWSTAHRKATGLVLDRRPLALAQVLDPVDTLLLEWSTPPDLDRGDREGWRAASPHWSPARERVVAKAYRKVLRGESVDPEEPDPIASFDAQWLNRWPDGVAPLVAAKDEPYVAAGQWVACLDELAEPDVEAPLFVAVEDDGGSGAVAAAGALSVDGRVVVNGHRFASRREAVDWAEDVAESSDDAVLLVGASLIDDTELEGVEVPVEPAGRAETAVALPLLRELVRFGRLAHEDRAAADPVHRGDATRAVVTARVRPGAGGNGILLTAGELPALLRCLAWVTQRAHRDRA